VYAQSGLFNVAQIEPSDLRPNQDSQVHPGRPRHWSIDDVPLPGIADLWSETLGDPTICVAILDGPVDTSHPSLRGANLTQFETLVPGAADGGPATQHGTHVASVIFGQHGGPVLGIAPRCRGLVIPIFESVDDEVFRSCSQLDFARAINQALQNGADIINVSGGQFSPAGAAHPLLADVVRACSRRGVLIVAAAGNDGCDCLHVPAAMESVLAVGAMDDRGEPLDFSNWGNRYRSGGVLAPGENVVGAGPGGGTIARSGTSYATPYVSGIAALLLSLQRKRGQKADTALVRDALVQSTRGCDAQPIPDCRRLLAGRLNVTGALSIIIRGSNTMSTENEIQASDALRTNQSTPAATVPSPVQSRITATPPQPAPTAAASTPESSPQPEAKKSSCGCQAARTAPQLVYALGQIGYDLVSEARLDSLSQKMAGLNGDTTPERVLAFDPQRMLAYLEGNPWDAAAIEWTLSVDGTPIYAIRPVGPFAAEGYKQLRTFLRERVTEGVDRFSIPGIVAGKTTLLMGQTVPLVVPELRGMYSWTTSALVEAVVGSAPGNGAADIERDGHEQKRAGVQNFLHRVYHEARNLGTLPQDRALNFAATNAFAIEKIYESALREKMDLDEIKVVPSPICRPGSDCWDVEVYFFYPERQVQTVRKVYRFTVDVSDTVPVTVGPTRAWFSR
jgi:cyanobactin maturation PatA/PatG family protease